jgi:rhamnulose-1-phosphate aldolase
MKASEGRAGNISVCFTGFMETRPLFPESRPYEAPGTFPELAGKCFLVTGSGCRWRDISRQPTANLALLKLGPDGCSGRLFMHPDRYFDRLTSEFNSHLLLHQREFQ